VEEQRKVFATDLVSVAATSLPLLMFYATMLHLFLHPHHLDATNPL
jgi:hypothetical protein